MEAWDNDDRVRPIPIEDEDANGLTPLAHTPNRERASTTRPWIPLVVSSIAVAATVVTVSLLGGLRFDDSPATPPDVFASPDVDADGSTPTPTATAVPPRLDEVLPDTNQHLTIIARNGEGLWALLWDPSFREPKAVPLDIPVGDDESVIARFDRGGSFVAVSTCIPDNCGVYVGSPTEPTRAEEIPPGSSFVWHATEVGRIAWAEYRTDSGGAVTTATVNPLSGALTKQEVAFNLAPGESLRYWDSRGFIAVTSSGSTAYDTDGTIQWQFDDLHAVSATDVNVVMLDQEGNWQFVDRVLGTPVEIKGLGSTTGDGSVWISTSESADLVARSVGGRTSTALEVVGGPIFAKRIVSVQPNLLPFRFTEQGHYFVFVNQKATEMTFVDWARSASYRLSLPNGMTMVGFHLD